MCRQFFQFVPLIRLIVNSYYKRGHLIFLQSLYTVSSLTNSCEAHPQSSVSTFSNFWIWSINLDYWSKRGSELPVRLLVFLTVWRSQISIQWVCMQKRLTLLVIMKRNIYGRKYRLLQKLFYWLCMFSFGCIMFLLWNTYWLWLPAQWYCAKQLSLCPGIH